MDVNYTINRLQLRGTPGPLEPREPRINPDGTLEVGTASGSSLIFSPTSSLSASLQELAADLASLRAISVTDSDLDAEVAEIQATIDALAASGATDSEVSAALAPIQAAIALLVSEDSATATAIAAIQASVAGLDSTYATDAQLTAAVSSLQGQFDSYKLSHASRDPETGEINYTIDWITGLPTTTPRLMAEDALYLADDAATKVRAVSRAAGVASFWVNAATGSIVQVDNSGASPPAPANGVTPGLAVDAQWRAIASSIDEGQSGGWYIEYQAQTRKWLFGHVSKSWPEVIGVYRAENQNAPTWQIRSGAWLKTSAESGYQYAAAANAVLQGKPSAFVLLPSSGHFRISVR